VTATAPVRGVPDGAVAGSIVGAEVWDLRFPLPGAAGSDARHGDPVYSLPVCLLRTDADVTGTGITLTLGAGNDLVCRAVAGYAGRLVGAQLESLVADLGRWWRVLADESQLRWLGPHKGVTHLALASVLAAVLDAWALGRGRPLWELLLELPTEVS
jgi:L-fuconate dehydratase